MCTVDSSLNKLNTTAKMFNEMLQVFILTIFLNFAMKKQVELKPI